MHHNAPHVGLVYELKNKIMITKEQITEILNNHAGYIDRSRTEQAVHEDNFNDVADDILSKLSQHDVIKNEVAVCDNEWHESNMQHFGECYACGLKSEY